MEFNYYIFYTRTLYDLHFYIEVYYSSKDVGEAVSRHGNASSNETSILGTCSLNTNKKQQNVDIESFEAINDVLCTTFLFPIHSQFSDNCEFDNLYLVVFECV